MRALTLVLLLAACGTVAPAPDAGPADMQTTASGTGGACMDPTWCYNGGACDNHRCTCGPSGGSCLVSKDCCSGVCAVGGVCP